MSTSSGPVASTIPYAWPYDGVLVASRTALVIAGAQTGWLAASSDGAKVCAQIASLSAALRDHGVLIVAVSHIRPEHLPASAGPGRSAVPVIDSVLAGRD